MIGATQLPQPCRRRATAKSCGPRAQAPRRGYTRSLRLRGEAVSPAQCRLSSCRAVAALGRTLPCLANTSVPMG